MEKHQNFFLIICLIFFSKNINLERCVFGFLTLDDFYKILIEFYYILCLRLVHHIFKE